jgi:hypothetical protein
MKTYQQHSNLQFISGVLSQLSFITSLFYTIIGAQQKKTQAANVHALNVHIRRH